MSGSGWLWGVPETNLHKTDETETRSWKKIQDCLTWKGLKISLPYAHFQKNLEAHEYIIGKTINFLAERIPQKESDPHDPEKDQGMD